MIYKINANVEDYYYNITFIHSFKFLLSVA